MKAITEKILVKEAFSTTVTATLFEVASLSCI